ncbi:hypothetical protein [Moraxella oblonga]|nr:hypothetical protein [Moraxella oblonga]
MTNNTKQKQTAHSLPCCHNPKATMKQIFKTIQIYLPKDDKFDRKFANSR